MTLFFFTEDMDREHVDAILCTTPNPDRKDGRGPDDTTQWEYRVEGFDTVEAWRAAVDAIDPETHSIEHDFQTGTLSIVEGSAYAEQPEDQNKWRTPPECWDFWKDGAEMQAVYENPGSDAP